jgi:hypothetical protein
MQLKSTLDVTFQGRHRFCHVTRGIRAYNIRMAEVEKVAVICPFCRKPTYTGFELDIEAFRTNLSWCDAKDYKTQCARCGEWIIWREAELIPERLVH